MNTLWFIPVGLLLGALGTLIGAGGGFMMMPLLLLLYPQESPELLTSISLAAVCANATSGSVAYIRMRRVNFRAGWMFAAAGVPGTILGAMVTSRLSRGVFDPIMGGALVLLATFLLVKAARGGTPADVEGGTDQDFNAPVGVGISVGVGFLSSLLGIGGGIIHVPALVYVLRFPAHVATATSHFVLAISTLIVTVYHGATGGLTGGWERAGMLAIGVVIGAQVGARLSRKLKGAWIIRCLAVALMTVGARVVYRALH
ncbi:MAG TPA: sulfite exporter TauE/SafE family protein [Polyangiaceae bacterium]|nr:sulfite exporter TauE/SafE family protein [Polyangiaceae bacterium]